ncbi:MAG: GNAT family N-acetyltransferase [Actinomycetota bacterium]
MAVTLRPYRGWDDLEARRRIVGVGVRDAPDRSYVHPGDVSWWIGWAPKTPDELARLCVVWEDAGEMLGWAMSDDGDVIDVVAPRLLDLPLDEEFRRAVDAWVRSEQPEALRYASNLDVQGCERLEASGYRATGDAIVAFRRRLDAFEHPQARVRALQAGDDVHGRASITHAAFEVERPLSAYVEEYATFARSPAYPSGWDLVAEDDAGNAAACCIAWPDPISRSGNFEPVATHPWFARRGFASAVMLDGMRRLRDAGISSAIVRTPLSNTAAQALYRSLGFEEWHRLLVFARPTAVTD